MNSKDIDFNKFSKMLEENGYGVKRKSGSHYIYGNDKGETIVINNHLNRMVARRIIKENNLVSEEFCGVLRLK